MKDRLWQAAYRALLPHLTPSDRVLAPRGGWDAFPCPVRFYDGLIEPGDASVLMLHKGRLPAIAKPALARIVAEWQCLFANGVFAVFAWPPRAGFDVRAGWRGMYLGRIDGYLRSRALKRLSSTLFYVHLPKTGGTSAWLALSRRFKSSVYFSDVRMVEAHPPEPGEYDLVGLHFAPALLDQVIRPTDLIAGLVRAPTERFLSGIRHWRRSAEDEATLTPSQQAMRTMRLAEFLATEHGRYETRLQLLALSAKHAGPALTDEAMLVNAFEFLDRPNVLMAPSTEADRLMQRLSRDLDVRLPRLGRHNAASVRHGSEDAAEIAEALPMIEALNRAERRLYEAVCDRFKG